MTLDMSTPDEVVNGKFRVLWVELGEGLVDSEYDPENPDDEEMLRFDFEVNVAPDGEDPDWRSVQDGSLCTWFPVAATPAQRQAGLELIMARVLSGEGFRMEADGTFMQDLFGDQVVCGPKRDFEDLSHIEPGWLDS